MVGAMIQPVTRAQTLSDYGEIFATHQQGALRLAYLLCGDRGRAEDAVSEAFARVYPKWKAGRVDDIEHYLRRAVVNQINGGWRRLRLERRDLERRHAEAAVSPASHGHADTLADRDQLRVALRALTPNQRAAVVLRYFEDLSEADTAAALGMSVGTVKSHVSRGLERLRAALDTEGELR